jgi:hypothetical protein
MASITRMVGRLLISLNEVLGTKSNVVWLYMPDYPLTSLGTMVSPSRLQDPFRKLHLDAQWPIAQT